MTGSRSLSQDDTGNLVRGNIRDDRRLDLMQAKDISLPAAAIPADEAESEETASAAEVPAISIEPPASPSAQEIPEETAPEAQAPSAARIYPFRRASRIRGQRRRRRPLLPACLIRTVAEIVQEDMENDQLLQLTAVLAKLGSLDDILNYAFEQTSRHNYSNALFAYKQALSRYHAQALRCNTKLPVAGCIHSQMDSPAFGAGLQIHIAHSRILPHPSSNLIGNLFYLIQFRPFYPQHRWIVK